MIGASNLYIKPKFFGALPPKHKSCEVGTFGASHFENLFFVLISTRNFFPYPSQDRDCPSSSA